MKGKYRSDFRGDYDCQQQNIRYLTRDTFFVSKEINPCFGCYLRYSHTVVRWYVHKLIGFYHIKKKSNQSLRAFIMD